MKLHLEAFQLAVAVLLSRCGGSSQMSTKSPASNQTLCQKCEVSPESAIGTVVCEAQKVPCPSSEGCWGSNAFEQLMTYKRDGCMTGIFSSTSSLEYRTPEVTLRGCMSAIPTASLLQPRTGCTRFWAQGFCVRLECLSCNAATSGTRPVPVTIACLVGAVLIAWSTTDFH